MKFNIALYKNLLVFIKNRNIPYIYDLQISKLDLFKEYSSFECHVVLYPYYRKISSDDIAMNPYEEYVKDITGNQRSSYDKIQNNFNKVFGLILGLIISVTFYFFKPDDLFSIQSLLAIFGAYVLGQEIWDDIERFLMNITKKAPIRYIDDYYRYRIEKNTTMTNYFNLAKWKRYNMYVLPAEKIDFIKNSNSQTVRMYFNSADLNDFNEKNIHVMSIHIRKELLKEFEKKGYMLGFKLCLNKNILFVRKSIELFQSVDNGINGCLDKNKEWKDNAVFFRKTYIVGRIKLFSSQGLFENQKIVKIVKPRRDE
jgi:hypothetical protein